MPTIVFILTFFLMFSSCTIFDSHSDDSYQMNRVDPKEVSETESSVHEEWEKAAYYKAKLKEMNSNYHPNMTCSNDDCSNYKDSLEEALVDLNKEIASGAFKYSIKWGKQNEVLSITDSSIEYDTHHNCDIIESITLGGDDLNIGDYYTVDNNTLTLWSDLYSRTNNAENSNEIIGTWQGKEISGDTKHYDSYRYLYQFSTLNKFSRINNRYELDITDKYLTTYRITDFNCYFDDVIQDPFDEYFSYNKINCNEWEQEYEGYTEISEITWKNDKSIQIRTIEYQGNQCTLVAINPYLKVNSKKESCVTSEQTESYECQKELLKDFCNDPNSDNQENKNRFCKAWGIDR